MNHIYYYMTNIFGLKLEEYFASFTSYLYLNIIIKYNHKILYIGTS